MRDIILTAVAGASAAAVLAACAPMAVSEAGPGRAMASAAALCQAGEEALFQCQAGARTIALCAGTSAGERFVQYRFGRPGSVELAYPARGMAGLSRATVPFSGGGETQVNFTNAGTRYSLFSSTVRTGFGDGPNMPQFNAGVRVLQSGRPAMEFTCTAPADASFAEGVYDLLPEGEPILGD